MTRNPLLPKGPIKWRTGPSAGQVGVPTSAPGAAEVAVAPREREKDCAPVDSYQKDPRGRKPKERASARRKPEPAPETPAPRAHPDAGMLSLNAGPFFGDSVSGWGSNLDMVALAHGPVGCGAFPQGGREELPGFVQGIESFASVHACTDLKDTDLGNGGKEKLSRALNEIATLFPLARGVSIVNEDPVALVGADIDGIAREETQASGRLIIPLGRGDAPTRAAADAAALKAAVKYRGALGTSRHDVALPFYRGATSLVWIISKLLSDIGLNPIHELTHSSTADMARIHRCKLVIGFAPGLSVSAAVRAFEQDNPGIDVAMRRLNWFEQAEALRDGRVDAGYLRRPFDSDGLRCIPVGSELAVACLPGTHPLAGRLSLTFSLWPTLGLPVIGGMTTGAGLPVPVAPVPPVLPVPPMPVGAW